MKKLPTTLLLACLLLGFACSNLDKIENVTGAIYEAEYALPLVDTKLAMEDIITRVEENSAVIIGPDGLITFTYSGDVITQTSEDVFASVDEALPPLIPVTSPRMALPLSSPDGLQIDRLDLKTGRLVFGLTSENPEDAFVTITFPQVKKDGEPLGFSKFVPGWDGNGDPTPITNALTPASLAGYQIITENDSIYIEYTAFTTPALDTFELSNFFINITNLTFSYAEGYLGSQVYEAARDTIEIDFFDNWIEGDIYFEDPTITFYLENSFGLPTRSIINTFQVLTVRGETLPLESEFITNGIDFPYPTLDEVGEVKIAPFVFNKDNSNIDVILGAGPVAIDYDVDALTNPDSLTEIRGFITDSSYYKVNVEVELPLIARATDFEALDTFDINIDDFEGANYAEFKFVTDNGLGLDIDLQASFLDESGAALDVLFENPTRIVTAAPVDENGEASGITTTTTYVDFPRERFSQIKKAKKIALSAAFSTPQEGQQSVRILNDQEVAIRMGVILGISNE